MLLSESSRRHAACLLLLAVLAALPIARELFSTTMVLSEKSTDVTLQYLFSRAFGFGEMARGNFPLWNPFIYSGIPYLGQFQSALLYPPNLIFLLLPLATAINWSFGLHVFLLGAYTYAWTFHRGLRPVSALVSGVTAMFSSAFFLHIYAGHLSNVTAMAWVPLIFLGIDGWLSKRHGGWIFLTAAAAALQMYAGHPQYVYYTALIAGLYSLAHLFGTARLPSALAGLLAIYPLASLLAAAQLLPGFSAASEAVRSGGLTYEFSSMFSFPPENFLTLLVPGFFAGQGTPYWGRCYLWEMSLHSGIGMLLLALWGIWQPGEKAMRIRLLVLLGLSGLLALGAHTPLHQMLYHILPGFSGFRGSSKFIFFAGLFLAFFAGMGFESLLRKEKPSWPFCVAGVAIGLSLLAAAVFFSREDGVSSFRSLMALSIESKESYLNPAALGDAAFLQTAQKTGVRSLQIAGFLCVFFSLLLLSTRRWQAAVWLIGIAAVLELSLFARSTVESFPLKDFTYPAVAEFLQKNPGDFRTLNMFNPDAAMLLRSENVWGYDPFVLKRYAQLLHSSQGNDPALANQYLQFKTFHPILAMLRCRLAFVPKTNGILDIVPVSESPFPRFFLASKYHVLAESGGVLNALKTPDFDLREVILLEQEPSPKPEKEKARYELQCLDSSTDHATLQITTDRAALLVVTDSYSKDWRAVSLPGSVQITYEILPANHALRAIPLAAGRHLVRMEFVPWGFHAGVGLSLISLLFMAASLALRPVRARLDFSGSTKNDT